MASLWVLARQPSIFLHHLEAAEQGQLPKRFVFVLKSSGLQGEYLNPTGLNHGGDQLIDESLDDRGYRQL